MHRSIFSRFGKLVIVHVMGDAEAFYFDWTALDVAQRAQIIGEHLAAFEQNMRAQGRDWQGDIVPFALLGTSMPEAIRDYVDELSAPHEGTLLYKKSNGRILYCAAADDYRAYAAYDAPNKIPVADSYLAQPFDVRGLDFGTGEGPTVRRGFTLEQMQIERGLPPPLTIGRRTGLMGVFERVFA